MTPLKGKRILVTGGLGFIGSHLVRRLQDQNTLVILDNGRRDALRLEAPLEHDNVRLIEADILDEDALAAATEDVQVVIHLAAMAGVSTYSSDPLRTIEVNLLGTTRLLSRLRGHAALERFVNVSTSEVYGPNAYHAREDGQTGLGPATQPRWSYASGKLAAEHLAMAHHHTLGMPVTSLRPFNVYGPGQLGEGAVRNFVVRALAERDLIVYGDGSQIRAWCYIDDLITGLLAAATRPEAVGHVFNIGNPRATLTILDLAERVVRISGSQSMVKLVPPREQEIQLRMPDIALARRTLGLNPRVRLQQGLERTIEWYRRMMESGVVFDG